MKIDLSHLMKMALEEAKLALRKGEVPVGAVIVSTEGALLARAHNMPITLNDPTAHAEILALREASKKEQNYRLLGATLVVTIEPCLMCMGALILARIGHLVYGAADPKAGAAGSLYNVASDQRLNHRIKVTSGIKEAECRSLIQGFFRTKRKNCP